MEASIISALRRAWGNVVGLGHHAAGDVDALAGIGELDEIGVVFQGGFAPPPVQIVDKGRSVTRNVSNVIAADGHVLLRVSRLKGVFGRRLGHLFHDHLGREEDSFSFDPAAGLLEYLDGRFVAEIHAHRFQYAQSRFMDLLDILVRKIFKPLHMLPSMMESVHPQKASIGPGRGSRSVEILDVALIRLGF